MVYAGDQWVQLPVRDLYDTQMMAMAINAARDMYTRAEKKIDDFYDKYGDFTSPIQKDMDSYNNIIGGVKDTINNIYARGGDPLRNAQDRAEMMAAIRNVPVGDINKLKQSADNARKYNEAVQQLKLAGLYNPETAALEGVPMDQYSTLDYGETPGNGVWGLMSPTPYHNMAQFSKDYFDNIKPFERSASKNGISYTVSEINENDLHRIADAHFNDLVKTPQGQLMYKLYLQQSNNDPNAARQAFNNAVVSGNLDRLYYSDNYQEADLKRQGLALQRERNALARQRLNKASSSGNKVDQEPFSYAGRLYRASLANAASNGGIQYNWFDVQNHYGDISKSIYTTQYDFGNSVADKLYKSKYDVDRENYRKSLVKDNVPSKTIAYRMKQWDNIHKNDKSNEQIGKSRQMIDLFRNRYEIEVKDPSTFVQWHGGSTVDGNKHVIQASDADISKLFGERFIISHTAGNKNIPLNDNAKLRNLISQYGSSNTTITPLNKVYGALMQDDGAFHTYARVKITINRGENEKPIVKYAYYDTGIHSGATSGGARNTDYNKQRKIAQGGYRQIGNVGLHYDPNTRQMVPNDVRYTYDPNATHEVDSEYNIYPDASSWLEFGPQDARVNDYLKAKGSVYNGAYGPETIDYDDFLFFDE